MDNFSNAIVKKAKSIYNAMPLNTHSKTKIRALFSKYLPQLLSEPNSVQATSAPEQNNLNLDIASGNIHTSILAAVAAVKNSKDFAMLQQHHSIKDILSLEMKILASTKSESFTVEGFCVPCNQKVDFMVDMLSGGQYLDSGILPNWRERLECPQCRLNNRQRLIATLIKQELFTKKNQQVYFMEQVTAIHKWSIDRFKDQHIIGSEYLGPEYISGTIINGIRHEDVENLSFGSGQLDLIISNDVLEHVPNPALAFAECARVLKNGGKLLATIPFFSDYETSITRARINNGNLEHILPPVYHGNPVSESGSLVFTDYGWDLLNLIENCGFTDVNVDVYASAEFAHLGGGQMVFRACKH